ncbi:MAG: hypothetical protein HY872_07050 [Chloroflexi bacterium]|nr:hypothetical protein [Chloroflexota bacterium]
MIVRRPPSIVMRFLPLPILVLALVACLGGEPQAAPTPALPTATPAPTLPPLTGLPTRAPNAPPLFASPEYGVQVFSWWHLDVGARDLDLVRGMGFTWVKQIFAWRDIEDQQKGAYNWYRPDIIVDAAQGRGLKLLVRLDHQPFWAQPDGGATPLPSAPPKNFADYGDFCHAVADRYKGRIAAYQVWNEPNLAREWGNQPPDPAAYVRLLAACYVGIKTADPAAIVISAGLAPTGTDDDTAIPDDRFVREMYAAGGGPYFDALGVHAAGYMNPPERSPDDTEADPALQARWITLRHVEDIRQIMVENGDEAKQIAILEMGWTTDTNPVHTGYNWYAVTEQQQARYLVGAYQWAKAHWQPWIGLMTTIYMADPDWTPDNEQYWFALNRPAFPVPDLRPAYDALKAMQK